MLGERIDLDRRESNRLSLLKELASRALIGSERHPPKPIDCGGELGRLLKEIATESVPVETQVLRSAGALKLYALSAYEAPKCAVSLTAPSSVEQLNEITSAELTTCLQQIIENGPLGLIKEILQLLIKTNHCLPTKLLPTYLDFGKANSHFKSDISKIAGQRGAWLAQFNSSWSYVNNHLQQLDKNMWENGNQEQRLLYIVNLRTHNPDEARDLISQVFSELDARERAKLLEVFYIGISDKDEAYLTAQLGDRSKEVRSTIALLLSHLPNCAFVIRQQNRILGYLKQERKLIRRHWVLEPPEVFSAEWSADTIEEKRHQSEGLGPRAWWLYQMARNVPLTWWEEQTKLSAEDLLTWAIGSDWSLALLRAWHQGLIREKNALWAEAFLKKMPLKDYPIDNLELIFLLPQKTRETYLVSILNGHEQNHRHGGILEYMVQHALQKGETFSSEFSNNILKLTKKYLADPKSSYDYALRQSLVDFVCLIPMDCFNVATQGWPVNNPSTEFFTETHAKVLSIIEQRKIIYQFLGGKSK